MGKRRQTGPGGRRAAVPELEGAGRLSCPRGPGESRLQCFWALSRPAPATLPCPVV